MTGMSNVSKLAGEPSGQEFLVFTLGNEEYGIDILKVQEIRGYDQVTRIASLLTLLIPVILFPSHSI
ncbi:chemotaxis protein CheW, partial [Salmonella enterica]|uniref:chemotaxis protein CheW n=1 Tax=Salmonella enterica TaxID=28901 RepID=UPI001481DE42